MRGRIWAPSAPGETSSIAGHWVGVLGLILAAAFSMLAAPFASAEVLPNGRVYEMVSPVKKNGNQAGSIGYAVVRYGLSTPSGDRLLYGVTGAIEGGVRGLQTLAVGNRTATGWRSSDPQPYPTSQVNYVNYLPYNLQASTDLTRFAFAMSGGDLVPGNPSPPLNPEDPESTAGALYVTDTTTKDVFWATKPTSSDPLPVVGKTRRGYMIPAGQSPNLDTLYYSYVGTLVPEDASRRPNVIAEPGTGQKTPRGLYRWRNGELVNYGSLPDGSFDPYGAIPAGGTADFYQNATPTPGHFNGQVSGDGRQAVYVSPDPTSGSGRVPQVYVRRDDDPAVLVTRSEVTGLPSASGPIAIYPPSPISGAVPMAYAYGSEDGSRVFFESFDALTSDATDDGLEKAYIFDLETEDLQYLPGVHGEPRAATPDLSSFVFARANYHSDKAMLGIWSNGSATVLGPETSASKRVVNGRSTPDGKVLLFETDFALSGFNNGGGFLEQVYRYDVASGQIQCVTCPPTGMTPQSNAQIGHSQTSEPQVTINGELKDSRSMSADGNRIFFDTADPLVNGDSNGLRDIYMWEDGKYSLISTGRSGKESFYIDNSESGDDVFFTTAEGISPEDVDGGYDVYDARVNGGFTILNPPSPCADASCQSPAASPPFNAGGSTEFNGAGNVKEKTKKPPCAKGKVRKQGKCVKKQQKKSQKRTATTKQGSGK